jgi:hypothetical protein
VGREREREKGRETQRQVKKKGIIMSRNIVHQEDQRNLIRVLCFGILINSLRRNKLGYLPLILDTVIQKALY